MYWFDKLIEFIIFTNFSQWIIVWINMKFKKINNKKKKLIYLIKNKN